jgi:NAD-dependent SIR2 family protein deacetylase
LFNEEEKNVSVSDKKRMRDHKRFRSRKSKGEYWTLYEELVDDKMKCYQYFRMSKHQFHFLLQKIEKMEKEYYLTRSNITCAKTDNLPAVSALNVTLLKHIY